MTTRLAEYRTAGDLWRGLAAAALLVAVVGGAPLGLLAIGADPQQLIPDQWPRLSEIRQWPDQAWRALRWAYYDGSLTPTILLLIVWAAWLTLVWMVLAEITVQVRHGAAAAHRRLSTTHPRGWICGLVTAVLVLASSSATTPLPFIGSQPVATAHHNPPHPYTPIDLDAAPLRLGYPGFTQHPAQPPAEVVQPPTNGHYDSLWRIAERRLGAGSRWPQIWTLNKGQTQLDGRVFTHPNLIQPGWLLRLPEPAPPTAPWPDHNHDGAPDPTAPPTPTHRPEPTSPAPSTQTPPAAPATNAPHQQPPSDPGITVAPGAFVGLGLAALITAAAFTVRLRLRRHYRPGSGERDTITTTPIVRALRRAHDKATLPHDDDGAPIHPNPPGSNPATRDVMARNRAQHTAADALPTTPAITVGVRDGQARAIHLARTRGLGLVGPGATAAARALLVALIADTHRDWPHGEVVVVIPAADIHALLDDPTLLHNRSTRLRVVDNLDAALDLAEAQLLTRTRRALDSGDSNTLDGALFVLVATPAPHAARRLQAILDNGSTLGIAGVLLGPWQPGTTALVRPDGTITSTTHNPGGPLTGTRLFTLPPTDTRALLDLLNAADEATENAPHRSTRGGRGDVRPHPPLPDHDAGSGRGDDVPVAPAVGQLRLAHLRATAEPDEDDDLAALVIGSTGTVDRTPGKDPAGAALGPGVRDGREIAVDLAVARGLGLVGPGAPAATRALLMALLTPDAVQTGHAPSAEDPAVIVPIGDLAALLGPRHAPADLPAQLRVVADLDTALDELDAEILRRTHHHDVHADSRWPTVALVASPPDGSTRRLQAVLDSGAPLGIVGVLLGQWPPGITGHVLADGTISATNPGVGEALEGTRIFELPEADITALLRQAQPDNPVIDPAGTRTATQVPDGQHPPSAARPATPAANVLPAEHRHEDSTRADDNKLEVTAIPAEDTDRASPDYPPDLPPDQTTQPPDTTSEAGVTIDHATRPITIRVLGPPQVFWRPDPSDPASPRDIIAAFAPRQRELLVFLAVHPDGVHRDTLVATLWGDNPPERPTNALNTALSRLRRALAAATDNALPDLTVVREGRYQLDPTLADVDYWVLRAAVFARRAASTDEERITALRRVVATYTGRLADGMDTEWIDAAREATSRDALDAVAVLARAVVDTDPEYTLDLLETARAFDPHNEMLYRDIMRLQQRLGHLDAVPRTLTLLTTRLAEIDEQPTPQSVGLATRLRQRHEPAPADTANTHRRPTRPGNHRGNAAAS